MGGGSSLKLLTAVPLSLTSSQPYNYWLLHKPFPPWSDTFFVSGNMLSGNLGEYLWQYLNLKLCLSPNTEKREGSRMTYWLPSVVMVMRVFSANKKDPLVSQEDTSPPPPTNPNPHKTKTAFNQTIVFWSGCGHYRFCIYLCTNKWNWRGFTKNINLEYFTTSPENGWWCGSEWLGGKIR